MKDFLACNKVTFKSLKHHSAALYSEDYSSIISRLYFKHLLRLTKSEGTKAFSSGFLFIQKHCKVKKYFTLVWKVAKLLYKTHSWIHFQHCCVKKRKAFQRQQGKFIPLKFWHFPSFVPIICHIVSWQKSSSVLRFSLATSQEDRMC